MNKQMKQHLEAVVTALVEQDNAAATTAFHEYLRVKSQAILVGEAAEEDDEDEDKEPKGKKDDEDEDETEGESKENDDEDEGDEDEADSKK